MRKAFRFTTIEEIQIVREHVVVANSIAQAEDLAQDIDPRKGDVIDQSQKSVYITTPEEVQ